MNVFMCFIWQTLYISVLALRCYQCKYKFSSSQECKQNVTKCPLQCGSVTIYNSKHYMIMKKSEVEEFFFFFLLNPLF